MTLSARTSVNYLADLMREELAEIGIRDAVIINDWQTKSEKLTSDEFLVEAQKFSAENPKFDISKLQNYLKAAKISTITSQESSEYYVGDEIVSAIYPAIERNCNECKNLVLLSIDLSMSYEQTKRAIKEIINKDFNTNTGVDPNQVMLPFIISKERVLSGQVISNLDGAKKSINLMTAYAVGGTFVYQFFGESKPFEVKKCAPFMRFNDLFYAYKFQTDSNEDVFLLSQKELEIESCKIHGMEATCYDFLKIGNMAKISTTQKVFFVHSQEPSIDKIDEKKFWEVAKDYAGKEILNTSFFGKYPHPDWFASFMISWAFSGKLGNMPTHLSLLSPPAQGKTRMLSNFGTLFDQSLNDGGTIKGLVPSFANGIPREGYLIRCRRFAFVDEFLHTIQTSVKNGHDFDGGSYQLLKVLEHSTGEHSSAFGIIKAKPKMWCLFCSNVKPYEHIKNLVDLHEKLNVAFMSRLFWYVFDEEHLAFIKARKSEVMTFGDEASPKKDANLVSMTDFLHSFVIKIPAPIIEEISEKYRPYVPASLELDIYDSRMIMHIYRLLDGYCKYKSIVEARGRFICTPEDISELDAIFGRIVRSWSLNLDESQQTPAMRVTYLNSIYREIFDFIKKNQNSSVALGLDEVTLMRIKGIAAVEMADEMSKKEILKTIIGGGCKSYYTYDANI